MERGDDADPCRRDRPSSPPLASRNPPRPVIKVVNVVANVTTVPPKQWAAALASHLLQLAGAKPQIKGGLFSRQEGTSLFRPRCPGDLITHQQLAAAWRPESARDGMFQDAASCFEDRPQGTISGLKLPFLLPGELMSSSLPVLWPDSSIRHESEGPNPRCSGERVTILDEVRAFIARLSPQPVCDDCIAERLQLTLRQHADWKVRELAGSEGFERRKAECSLCGSTKLVIRRL